MAYSRTDTSTHKIYQSLLAGSVAGAAEVLVDHPFWAMKTRIQRNQPFTANPKILYRGLIPNAASMIPVTALQVTFYQISKFMFTSNDQPLTLHKEMISGFVAGVSASVVSCPTEMLITSQSKIGGSFYHSAKTVIQIAGLKGLYTGMAATAIRDGIFSCAFLAVAPQIKKMIRPNFEDDRAATVSAGIAAGVCAMFATQAIDYIKTKQQSAKLSMPVSFVDTFKDIYSKGWTGFFTGGIPRGIRVISGVTIISLVKENMESRFR